MTETDTKPAPAKKIEKRLYPKEWFEIAEMAKAGVSVKKIAKTFKVQPSTIYRGLRMRRIRVGAYSPTPADEKAKEERSELVRKVQETKSRDYTYTDFIQRQVMSILTDAQKTGTPVGNKIEDIKALKVALDAIKAGTANKWMILGLDRENENADTMLPELPIRELTQAEMIAIRDRQALEDLDDDALERLDVEIAAEDDDEDEVIEEGSDEPDEK